MSYVSKDLLVDLYIDRRHSVPAIARHLSCSEHKVNYWLQRYGITKRTISEAMYLKAHPLGDPFRFRYPRTADEERLFGLGVGLYWGEGNKANKNAIRLGNSDPKLIASFVTFLETFFGINRRNLKFGLQLFSDIDPKRAMAFWKRKLKIKDSQLYQPTITRTGQIGTYRRKSVNGVMTLYYLNTKARNVLMELLQKEAN